MVKVVNCNEKLFLCRAGLWKKDKVLAREEVINETLSLASLAKWFYK